MGVNSPAAAAAAGTASTSASFPGHRSAAATRPLSGPSAGRGPAAWGGQPRAQLLGFGHSICGGSFFPACGRITAWSPPSAAAMGTDSRAARALLARARTLHLQTGNLLNWGRLRKKCPSTHSEEVRADERGPRRRASPGPGRGGGPRPGGSERPGRAGDWAGAHLGSARGRRLGPLSARLCIQCRYWGQRVFKNLAGATSRRVMPPFVCMAGLQTLKRIGSLSLARGSEAASTSLGPAPLPTKCPGEK